MKTVWLGLAAMIGSQIATIAQLEPFWSWNTPIAWTGFILAADGIVFRARGDSWIRSNPREFWLLALLSIPLWLVFEAYNQVIHNWHYVGLPERFALRMFGYGWAFATIWPAIFEGAELIAVWRRRRASVAPAWPRFTTSTPTALSATGWVSVAAGVLMLASPFVVPPGVRPYMAAPIWLGFIFLLDPINERLGGESLTRDLRSGHTDRLINLCLSGLLCGFLWEFLNYWSRAKWHYTVPIMERVKLFEMPLPGYLGFPAFALECFTMYVFVRLLIARPLGLTSSAASPEERPRPVAL